MPRLLAACAVAFLTLALPRSSPAATVEQDRTAVLAAVQVFFDSLSSCDVEAARSVLDPEGRFVRVAVGAGDEGVRSTDLGVYLELLEKCEEKWVERMWEPKVQVREGVAQVWAPYDFWRNGEFSHCGFDGVDLIETSSGWKITGGVYSVRTTDCEESPLGPLEP